jgi:hypothetical protein
LTFADLGTKLLRVDRWLKTVMRFAQLVVLLASLPIVFDRAWPAAVELLGGQAPHICHCDVAGGHMSCACPICHPEDQELKKRILAVQGPCGDTERDHIAPPDLPRTTIPSVSLWVPASEFVDVLDDTEQRIPLRLSNAPETPPPRT